jgi:hypothetical protein
MDEVSPETGHKYDRAYEIWENEESVGAHIMALMGGLHVWGSAGLPRGWRRSSVLEDWGRF